jgi:hypothetical protein
LKIASGCVEQIGAGADIQSRSETLRRAEDRMSVQRAHWERRLDQLDAYLNTPKEPKP